MSLIIFATFSTFCCLPVMVKVLSSSPVCIVLMSTPYIPFIFFTLSPPLPIIFAAISAVVLTSDVVSSSFWLVFPCSFLIVISKFSISSLWSCCVIVVCIVIATSSAIMLADSFVRWRPSPFIWALWSDIFSIFAVLVPCLSARIPLIISLSLCLCSALIWGWYTGGSWMTMGYAPASVIRLVVSLWLLFTLLRSAPCFRSFVPASRTIVFPSIELLFASSHRLASVRVGAQTFSIYWFVHLWRCG